MAEIDQHCWFWYFLSTSALNGRISHHCWFQYFQPCLGFKFYHCWFWCCITIYCFKLQDLATSATWYFLPTYALNCRIDHQRWFWYFLLRAILPQTTYKVFSDWNVRRSLGQFFEFFFNNHLFWVCEEIRIKEPPSPVISKASKNH